MASDALARMRERLDLPPAEAWRPEPNQAIMGEVVDVDVRTGDWGPYPVITLDTGDGKTFAVHCFHTVLRNEVAKRRPAVGDAMGFKYLGVSPKGYESYRVEFAAGDGRNAAPVEDGRWEAMRQSAAAELGETTPAEAPFPEADQASNVIPATPYANPWDR